MMMRQAFFIPIVFALAACDWPLHGEGGFDESFRYSRFERTVTVFGDDLDRAHMSRRIDVAKHDLDTLSATGASEFSPANLRTAHILWGRITRSFTTDMLVESDQDLIKLEASIQSMRETVARERALANNQEPKL